MSTRYKDRELPKDTFLELLTPRSEIGGQKDKVRVRCVCGKEYQMSVMQFFRPTKMCYECTQKNKFRGYEVLGGLRKHKAYNCLDAIKQRCYNKNSRAYKWYGGIGIKVCDEWLRDYHAFCEWADKNGFAEGMTIDRIDPTKDYTPENCRFISKKAQRENKHIQKNNTSGYAGVSYQKSIKKWFSYVWVDRKRINLGYYKTAEEANMVREKYLRDNNIPYKRHKADYSKCKLEE